MATSFPPFRRDRNKFEGGKIVYVKDGFIVKRLNDFEINISDTISLKLTLSNKKLFVMFVYRPPIKSNKLTFFNEVSNTLNKAVNKYDNILVTGDLSIDFSNCKMDKNNYLSVFIDTFP